MPWYWNFDTHLYSQDIKSIVEFPNTNYKLIVWLKVDQTFHIRHVKQSSFKLQGGSKFKSTDVIEYYLQICRAFSAAQLLSMVWDFEMESNANIIHSKAKIRLYDSGAVKRDEIFFPPENAFMLDAPVISYILYFT